MNLSGIKLITRYAGPDRFSAAVVRLQIHGHPVQTKGPATILEAIECASDIEALQRLYGASQLLLDRACELSPQCDFNRWDNLVDTNFEDDWDCHCGMASVASGSVV